MWRAHLKLNFVVFLWSFTAILGKLITIPRFELVFLRTSLAGIFLLVFWLGFQRRSRADFPRRRGALFANGMLIGLHWVLFFTAAKSNASICLAGIATTTLWTAILEPLMTPTHWKRSEILLGLVIACALGVMYRLEGNGLALLAGLGAAIAAAAFSIINGQIARDEDAIAVTILEMAGASVFCLGALLISVRIDPSLATRLLPTPMDWLWLFLIVTVCTAYAYVAYIQLLRRLSVFSINLAANFEPIYGMILAAILLGEYQQLTLGFYLSTLAIVGCVTVHLWIEHCRKP